MLIRTESHYYTSAKTANQVRGLSYEIQCRKGKENVAIDALSRKPTMKKETILQWFVIPEWMKEVIESYNGDGKVQDLIKQLLLTPSYLPNYTYQDGVLTYNGRVVIGTEEGIRKKIFTAIHDS